MTFTVRGNGYTGYRVMQRVNDEWVAITKRYDTYREAAAVCADIYNDNSEATR